MCFRAQRDLENMERRRENVQKDVIGLRERAANELWPGNVKALPRTAPLAAIVHDILGTEHKHR